MSDLIWWTGALAWVAAALVGKLAAACWIIRRWRAWRCGEVTP